MGFLNWLLSDDDNMMEAANQAAASQPGIMQSVLDFITFDPQAPDGSGHTAVCPEDYGYSISAESYVDGSYDCGTGQGG